MKKQIFLLLFAVLSAACELTDLQEKDISVSSVSLSQATAETIPGETVQLIATVLPANASDKTVGWASSNKSVATVSDSGLVTAIAEGSSTITASCGGKSATCQVTVRKATVAVSDVTLDQTDLKLTVGDEALLKATVSPYDATDRAVTWNSSDESIVSVDQGGRVKAIAEGSATIRATAGGKTANCKVSVSRGIIPVAAIALDRITLTLEETQSTTLVATVSPADATDKTVNWTTSDASVATIDQNGLVTAVKQGAATISAKAGSQTATCKVTVQKRVIPVTAVTINRTSLSLVKGQKETLKATVSPADATDKTVTWSSSDATIVSVDQTGEVTALKGGSATVMAKAGDQSATCSITVTVPVQSLALDRVAITLEERQTTTLVATVSPSDATDKTVIWTSSDETVTSVDQNGKVTAIHEGTASIMAQSGDKTATCSVTVTREVIPVKSVGLDKTRLNLTVGAVEQLTATVDPDNATDKTITWSSSDATVVSVDQNGKVKALKGGTATITAAAGDKSATAFVDVLAITPESVKVEGEGGRFDVTVISQRGYHMSSKPDWVHEISVERQVHHFEVPANNSDQERNGIISFCDDEGVCLACIVSQEGYLLLEAGTGHLDFDLHGGSEEIRVTSTLDWTVSSSENWCVPTPASGSGNGTFTVSVGEFRTEGTRSATLTLKGGGLIQTIEVFQEGIVPFSVTPASVEIGESGGSFEVLVKSSFGYHLDGMSDWIGEVSEQNKKHTFQVAANPLERDRSGFISFCDDNGTSLTVSVKQAAHIPGPDDIDWTRDFYHRSLVMRFTATWCPHCPVMHQTVARALADYPGKLVHVAIHGYDSKLYNDSVAPLISTYRISGYPTSVVDGRVQIHNEGVDIAAPKIIAAAKETESLYGTNTGIAINSSLSGRKVDIQLTAYSKKAGKYKLTILLLEDGIITPQSGASSGIFVHNDVARATVTNARGDAFTLSQDQSYKTFSYSATIPENCELNNMKILVFIQDQDRSYIDNSLMAPIGKRIPVQQVSDLPGGGNEGISIGDDILL